MCSAVSDIDFYCLQEQSLTPLEFSCISDYPWHSARFRTRWKISRESGQIPTQIPSSLPSGILSSNLTSQLLKGACWELKCLICNRYCWILQ